MMVERSDTTRKIGRIDSDEHKGAPIGGVVGVVVGVIHK